jgi:hypothetical protein
MAVNNNQGTLHTNSSGVTLIQYPEGVSKDYPTWVKYELWDYTPDSTKSSKGATHIGMSVKKLTVASIALGSDAPVTITEAQNWSQDSAGGILSQIAAAAAGGFIKGDGFWHTFTSTLKAGGNKANNFKDGISSLADKKLSNLTQTNTAVVDKLALKYAGPSGPRSFSMTHTFTPRSKREGTVAQKIIKLFRKYSSPSMNKDHGEFYTSYKYPTLFKVIQMAGEKPNKAYPPFDVCYCKSVNVEYGDGAGNTFYGDNTPVTYKLTLEFEEISVVTKESIEGES